MLFIDALDATEGPWPITRITNTGEEWRGYLNGSVDIFVAGRRVRILPAGAGPKLGHLDWQPRYSEGRACNP